MGPLPELFVERLSRIVPAERFEACLASFAGRKPVALRVNTLRAAPAEVRAELEAAGFAPVEVPWLAEALLLDLDDTRRRRLTESASVAEGRAYLQGLSSMIAPMALDPRGGDEVLDLAAAPGGKTLQMAAMMRNEGRIAAVEAVRARLFKLQANLRRAGVAIAETYLCDGRSVGRRTPERFDRVLLDAPCSSESRFDLGRPESWCTWSPRKIRECARKQKGLLRSAVRAAKPGGVVLYCTCSFAPEENEAVVDDALRRFGEVVEVVPMALPIENVQHGMTRWEGRDYHSDVVRAARILPDARMDGFFLCKLVKREALPATRERRLHRHRFKRRPDSGRMAKDRPGKTRSATILSVSHAHRSLFSEERLLRH